MDRISEDTLTDTQLVRVKSILTSESSGLRRQADRYTALDETEAATQADRDAKAVESLLAAVVNEQRQRRIDAQVLANMKRQYGEA